MCWDSDINWIGLRDQYAEMEAGLPGSESSGPILCQESWDLWRSCRSTHPKSSNPDPVYPEFDNPINSIRRKTRASNNANTE